MFEDPEKSSMKSIPGFQAAESQEVQIYVIKAMLSWMVEFLSPGQSVSMMASGPGAPSPPSPGRLSWTRTR